MRAYFIGNMYLSSIQQGIQAAHVVTAMAVRYRRDDDISGGLFWEWAFEHKTMVLLNGGYQSELEEFYDFLRKSKDNPFPFEMFREEQDALNGAMTSVGIILPEPVYAAIADIREGLRLDGPELASISSISYFQLSDFEKELAIRLSKFGLAR